MCIHMSAFLLVIVFEERGEIAYLFVVCVGGGGGVVNISLRVWRLLVYPVYYHKRFVLHNTLEQA